MSNKKSRATREAQRGAAAERAAAVRREQERGERRRRSLMIGAIVVVALAVIAGIAYAVQSGRSADEATSTPPEGIHDTYALGLGDPDAPATVTVYEDFLCPFCADFEAASNDSFAQLAESGDAFVEYRVIAFLNDYSTRAANAFAVVLDQEGPEVAKEFHDLLFANQPAEGGDMPGDDFLVDLAVEAGADEDAVRGPIEDLAFEGWVTNAEDQASQDGVNGTPTVLVNGEVVEGGTIDEVYQNALAAIEAAG